MEGEIRRRDHAPDPQRGFVGRLVARAVYDGRKALPNAVREVFVRLYEEGWIYRGTRIVNWCPRDKTVLSDLEVKEEKAKDGKLYYLQYPVKGSAEKITVATTRPETMLGDTAVAVNPEDERYAHLIGKTIELPLNRPRDSSGRR